MRNWGMRRAWSENRRLVTSKETASLPTKEATNVDADGPQGGAQGRPFRERVDAGNPRSSPRHKARNRLPMGARQVTAQADTREGARAYGRATRGVSPPEGRSGRRPGEPSKRSRGGRSIELAPQRRRLRT